MPNLVVGLFAAVAGLTIQYLFLRKYKRWLQSREQAYSFHALRDRLQLLAIERKIEQNSIAYRFLLFGLNLSIKNAGRMRLSHALAVARLVDKRSTEMRNQSLMDDIKRQGDEVIALSADTFAAFALMLIRNDNVLFIIYSGFKFLIRAYTHPYPATVRNIGRTLLGKPRAEALREARKYDDWCSRLCPSR